MKHTRQAFTLIELLTVIAITGVLMTILMMGLRQSQERVQLTIARQCAHALITKAAEYVSEHNTYEGFTALGDQRPDSGCAPTQKMAAISFTVTQTTDQWVEGQVSIASTPTVTLVWNPSGISAPIKP